MDGTGGWTQFESVTVTGYSILQEAREGPLHRCGSHTGTRPVQTDFTSIQSASN